MSFSTLLPNVLLFAGGVGITALLTICSLAVGLVLATVFTTLSYSKISIIRNLIRIYTFVIRGTPLLVQIFLIYYGSSQFDIIHNSFMWSILKYPAGCAIIALSINSSGYCIILFRGIIESIPKGEFEACKVLGMSKVQMFFQVILGRFIRLVLPAYSNEVIIVLKSTSLASTITIMDLMGVTKQFISETYATITFFLLAGVLYLIMNLLIFKIFKQFEKKMRVCSY